MNAKQFSLIVLASSVSVMALPYVLYGIGFVFGYIIGFVYGFMMT